MSKDFTNIQMLKEMVESMTISIDNVDSVIKQQLDLIEIVEKSDKKEQFEDFISGLTEENDQRKKNTEVLICRRDTLKEICDNCDKDESIAKVVENLLIGLGVFSR